MIAEGHELGAHTFTHADMASTPSWRRSAEMTLDRQRDRWGDRLRLTLYRPPYSAEPGAMTGSHFEAMKRAAAAGYLVVLADLDTEDWRRSGADAIVKAATPSPVRARW